ncbi:asparagine synthase (glutamine-hydrolyzing) [Fulvivirgaceae bacterium BMA10]|uniref:asparagine synthase (glutamine-hydrolyzing) n=1 Tax=Splendidivirga corallicola TaxID=3051826 RepID=A0ABT8KUF0_9BACT|nr:asparagine synthase (glutamine-hydrolyzing) [Fulvivirgaceae bacterium BMA10]
MCGINFILDKKKTLDKVFIDRMNRATSHRGPDHDDTLEIESDISKFFLGHNRLKIIDLTKRSDQPFISDDKNFILIYNGEIYNFHDLKNQLLRKGYLFRSSSDTEVLFYWLIENGKEGLNDLQGMFSFIFINRNDQTVLMSRDKQGMKPLFYYEDDKYLIVSSEIQGIIASGLVQKSLNAKQISFYLNFRYASLPETFFEDIFELQPGSYLKKPFQGEKKIDSYQKGLKSNIEDISNNELLQKTEEILTDAVHRHLVCDVPWGLFLSGGVDSTLLLALIREFFDGPLQTFSIKHHQSEGSFGTEDGYYAKKASQQYRSDHYELEIRNDILDNFEDYVLKSDQPIGDSGALLTLMLSNEARGSAKMILSGAGADEIFAGYNRHLAYYRYLKFYKGIQFLYPILTGISKLLPTGFNHPLRKTAQLARKFCSQIDQNRMLTFINFTSLDLNKEMPTGFDVKELISHSSIQENMHAALALDRGNYLVSDVLALNDRMSMRSGIEMRMPFLDNELLDFIYTIPSTKLLENGRKWILSDLLKRRNGHVYTKRMKEGFGLPIGNWIRKGKASVLFQFLKQEKNIIFDHLPRIQIQQLLSDHEKGRADNSLSLWSIATLAKWLEVNFD